MSRPFVVERRAIPLEADLEAKVQRGLDVVASERAEARVKAVLTVLKAEPQTVQEGVMSGLKDILGKAIRQAQRQAQNQPSADCLSRR